MTDDLRDFWGDPIHTYTRAEALADGVLVNVTGTAREAGFIVPVALTVGVLFGKEEVALSVHITDFSGPLSPTACDASFALVKSFFNTYFPETPARIAVCDSWMLDPQLDEYMTPRSNIIQFKNRFNLAYVPEPNNRGIQQFVFGMLDAEIDELPQATSLERAVVEHIVSGKHWHGAAGWLEL